MLHNFERLLVTTGFMIWNSKHEFVIHDHFQINPRDQRIQVQKFNSR